MIELCQMLTSVGQGRTPRLLNQLWKKPHGLCCRQIASVVGLRARSRGRAEPQVGPTVFQEEFVFFKGWTSKTC